MTSRFVSLAKIPAEYWIHATICMSKCLFQKNYNFNSLLERNYNFNRISKFEPKVDNILILSLIASISRDIFIILQECVPANWHYPTCLPVSPLSIKISNFLGILYHRNFLIFHLIFLISNCYHLVKNLLFITSSSQNHILLSKLEITFPLSNLSFIMLPQLRLLTGKANHDKTIPVNILHCFTIS